MKNLHITAVAVWVALCALGGEAQAGGFRDLLQFFRKAPVASAEQARRRVVSQQTALLQALPEIVREPARQLLKRRPNEVALNAVRIQGLAVVGRSIEGGLGRSLPRPLRKLVAGIVEQRALQGYAPKTSAEGSVVHRSSGSVYWNKESDPLNPESLFFRSQETSSYEGKTITITDQALEMTLAHRGNLGGGYSPSSKAVWVVKLEDHPADNAWLKGVGRSQMREISAALGQQKTSTWIVKATTYLEFDAAGKFVGATTATRNWDIARPR